MSMVTSGVLFAINTTGAGKSKLAFAAVAAGVFILGKKLNEARINAEKFADAWVRLDEKQRLIVRSMENASKGLIDTNAEILSVHKITEAGMTASSKLMNAIALVAIDRAKKMGEGAEGATSRVVKLTDAITKGQTRALKEYGIELDATESLVDAQAEGMEKIIIRSKGLTAEVQTLTEQTYALNNNWETFLGLSVGRVGTIGVLGDLNAAFASATDTMMDSSDATVDVMFSMDGLGLSVASTALEMVGFEEAAWKLDSQLGHLIETQSKLKKIQSEGKKHREQLAYIGTLGPEQARVMQDAVAGGMDIGDVIGASQEVEKAVQRKAITGEGLPGARAGGGKGKAAAAPALIGEDKWAAELAVDQARKEEQLAHNEWLLANDSEYLDRMIQQEMDADAELTRLKLESDAELEEMYTIKRQATQDEKWAAQLEASEQEKLLSVEHHNWLLANSADYAKKQAEIDKAAALARMGGFKTMFTNLSSLMQTENKKAFYIGKAAAYASTVINTAEAAMASFKAMAGIPYVGPALGAIAAGAAITAGAVQLATIKKQKFGDSGGGVSAGAVGSTGGGYLGGGGNYAAGGAGGSQVTQVTVILGEEEFHGWSIAANDKASQKGDPHFADGQAA